MITLKESASKQASKIMHPEPVRSMASSGCRVWPMAEEKTFAEQGLWERVQEICLEYGQRYAKEVSVSHYQDLPPEAVSLVDPPERAWYVRLHLMEQSLDQTPGQMEVIVFLRDASVGIMLH